MFLTKLRLKVNIIYTRIINFNKLKFNFYSTNCNLYKKITSHIVN